MKETTTLPRFIECHQSKKNLLNQPKNGFPSLNLLHAELVTWKRKRKKFKKKISKTKRSGVTNIKNSLKKSETTNINYKIQTKTKMRPDYLYLQALKSI